MDRCTRPRGAPCARCALFWLVLEPSIDGVIDASLRLQDHLIAAHGLGVASAFGEARLWLDPALTALLLADRDRR